LSGSNIFDVGFCAGVVEGIGYMAAILELSSSPGEGRGLWCVAQVGRCGPLADHPLTCEQRSGSKDFLVGQEHIWGNFQADASLACIVGLLWIFDENAP
jgi:hypothetical protein